MNSRIRNVYSWLKKISTGLLISSGTMIVLLLLLELVVRIFFPQQLILLRPDIYIPDEAMGWRKAAHLNTNVNWGERTVHLVTDSNGHRIGEQPPVSSPDSRMLVVGDSFVEAFQVDYDQTFTALLEASLSAKSDESVSVVNSGTGQWDPNNYLANVQDEIHAGDYDLIIVIIYMDNDVVQKEITDLPPRAPTIRHSLRVPQNFSKAELIDALAYPANDFLETNSQLYILARTAMKSVRTKMGLSPYYFPNAMLKSSADDPDWNVTANICNNIALSSDIPTIFVLIPANYQIDESILDAYIEDLGVDRSMVDIDQPARLLTKAFQDRNLIIYDATPAFEDAYSSGMTDLYGKVDTHFSPNGHKVLAEFLMPIIDKYLSEGSQ